MKILNSTCIDTNFQLASDEFRDLYLIVSIGTMNQMQRQSCFKTLSLTDGSLNCN